PQLARRITFYIPANAASPARDLTVSLIKIDGPADFTELEVLRPPEQPMVSRRLKPLLICFRHTSGLACQRLLKHAPVHRRLQLHAQQPKNCRREINVSAGRIANEG